MSRPNQTRVLQRLENISVKACDDLRKTYLRDLYAQWQMTRRELKRIVWQTYRDVVHEGEWSYAQAKQSGALARIEHDSRAAIEKFRVQSFVTMGNALSNIYKESALRTAWSLDQVTPPSYKIRLPTRHRVMEAHRKGISVIQGEDALKQWRNRWGGWLDSYHAALTGNLTLGAINASSVEDAVGEVDASTAGTPASDIWAALQRIFMNVSQVAIALGQEDVSAENEGELGTKQIWQTRYNTRVCDDCEANAGLEREEVDEEIPAHPNCYCYWRVVPAEWADLLASGDDAERNMAQRMDAAGVLPSSMTLIDEEGNEKGHVVVNFEQWLDGEASSVTAGE